MTAQSNVTILPRPAEFSRFWLIVGWIICGVGMLGIIHNSPQMRTQEARVIVTAREMIGQPPERWLIPTANGEARLRKPPLAYWLSAISYEIFGYSTTAARIPALLSAWLTLGFTFLIAKHLFSFRTAFYSAGCLMGSWFFVRYGLLAETDVLVMCQMTAGIYFLIRAGKDSKPAKWLYLIAVMIALMALTKGPPAAYLLMLIVLADFFDGRFKKSNMNRSLTIGFFTSGAFLLAIAVALPWFVYAIRHIEGGQLTDDLSNSAKGGKGHAGMFWVYFPLLLQSLLPWSIIWLISGAVILKMIFKKTITIPMLFLVLWGSAILIPLMIWGNKQPHYLMTYLPAGAIAIGWLIHECHRTDSPTIHPAIRKSISGLLIFSLAIACLSVVLIPLEGKNLRGFNHPADQHAAFWIGGILLLIFVVGKMLNKWKLPEISIISIIGMLMVTKIIWLPSLEQNTPAMIARQLQSNFPDAKLVFRQSASLPLCVEFGRVIPVLDDLQLTESIDENLICIGATRESQSVLAGYKTICSIKKGENPIEVFARDGSKWDRLETKNAQP